VEQKVLLAQRNSGNKP